MLHNLLPSARWRHFRVRVANGLLDLTAISLVVDGRRYEGNLTFPGSTEGRSMGNRFSRKSEILSATSGALAEDRLLTFLFDHRISVAVET